MNIEDRLREHLAQAGEVLPEPPDRIAEVVRRGRRRTWTRRGAVAVTTAALLLTAPIVLRGLDRTQVDLEPAQPGPAPTPTETAEPPADALSLADLGAPVLAWGPYEHDHLLRVDGDREEVVVPHPVDVAYPDGIGGVVYQPASQASIHWTSAGGPLVDLWDPDEPVDVVLRGLLPQGRVLYSVRPAGDTRSEGATEEFFTVALAQDAEPEHLTSTSAFERTVVGPAVAADRQLVHASCHLLCSLWLGLADGEGDEPLYHGGGSAAGPTAAIEGLTATPDGRVVGFVEFNPTHPESGSPELVLLDGTSFAELARVPLPDQPENRAGVPVVSLSEDARRVLVSLGASGEPGVPTAAYLVEDAVAGESAVHPIDFAGAVRWDPGAPLSRQEHDAIEALFSFAATGDRFNDVPFADEVLVGLGPELAVSRRVGRSDLADPEAWLLAADGFRARAGELSALEVLRSSGGGHYARGPRTRCASPPMRPADELAGLRQLSIQPTETETCLQWFAVDVFVNDDGAVAAVTLDLYEP